MAHATEIKRLCGPAMPHGLIDQQEVFGFALADGLGRPLIPHDRARGVGSAGDDAIRNANRAKPKQGALRRAKEAKREAVRKATAAAHKDALLVSAVSDAEHEGDRSIAEILSAPCNLKLPNETVGAKRTREAAPAAEAKRPPSLAELEAQVRKAEATCDALFQKRDAYDAGVERAQRQLDVLRSEPHVSSDEFYSAESEPLWADGRMDALLDIPGRYREWRDEVEARWQKTPVGRAATRLRDAQRERHEASCARTRTHFSHLGHCNARWRQGLRLNRSRVRMGRITSIGVDNWHAHTPPRSHDDLRKDRPHRLRCSRARVLPRCCSPGDRPSTRRCCQH